MDINSQHHNLLGNQIRGFLYFGGHLLFKMATIANRNGRSMVQHVLLPVNIHFHWNLLIFILVAILKTKSTTLSDDLFVCPVSKGSAVWSEFNIFCTLVTMAMATILNFFSNPKKLPHTRWIFLQSLMKFDERNPNFF